MNKKLLLKDQLTDILDAKGNPIIFNIIENNLYHANPDLYAIYGKVSAFTIPDDDYEYTFKLIKNSNEISKHYHYRLVISRATSQGVENPLPLKVLESIPLTYPVSDSDLGGIDKVYRLFGLESDITKLLQQVLVSFIDWHHLREHAPLNKDIPS